MIKSVVVVVVVVVVVYSSCHGYFTDISLYCCGVVVSTVDSQAIAPSSVLIRRFRLLVNMQTIYATSSSAIEYERPLMS